MLETVVAVVIGYAICIGYILRLLRSARFALDREQRAFEAGRSSALADVDDDDDDDDDVPSFHAWACRICDRYYSWEGDPRDIAARAVAHAGSHARPWREVIEVL